ncbi:MAG: hypothetical protein IJ147_03320 [Lachnospiraceae bacterium]|nr:hypothetical protein [Lachnospiraceae bacterium]
MNFKNGIQNKDNEHIAAEKITFAVTLCVIALYHMILPITFGDDMVYKTLLDDQTLGEFLRFQWENWTSRILIEFVLLSVIKYDLLWRVLDTVFVVTLGTMLGRITEEKRFSYAVLLLYPFHEMASAGWVNTTLNYLWPLWSGMLIFVMYKKYMTGEKLHWSAYLWSIPAVLFACDQEQMAVVMLIVTVGMIGIGISRKRYLMPYVDLMFLLNIACLVKMFICPGNQARSVTETSIRYAAFSELSVWDKIFLGVYNVESTFIARPHILFLPITLLLAFLVFQKTESGWKRGLAAAPAAVTLAHCVLAESMTKWNRIFWRCEAEEFDLEDLGLYRLPVWLFFGLVLCSLVFIMYILWKEQIRQFWAVLILWGAGLASAVMMGFSPTMFDSGSRTMLFFCFAMMTVIGMCVHRHKEVFLRLPQDVRRFWYGVGVLWVGAGVINELVYIAGFIKNTH